MGMSDAINQLAMMEHPEAVKAQYEMQQNEKAKQAFAALAEQFAQQGQAPGAPPDMARQMQYASPLARAAALNPAVFGQQAMQAASPLTQYDLQMKRAEAENKAAETFKSELYTHPTTGDVMQHDPNTGEVKMIYKGLPQPTSEAGKIMHDVKAGLLPTTSANAPPAAPQGDGGQPVAAPPPGDSGAMVAPTNGGFIPGNSGNPVNTPNIQDTVNYAMLPPNQQAEAIAQAGDIGKAKAEAIQNFNASENIRQQLITVLDKMESINDKVPSGSLGVPYTDVNTEHAKELYSNNAPDSMWGSDKGEAAAQAADWDLLNNTQLVSGISALASSGSVGRMDIPIINAVAKANGIDKTLNPKGRQRLIEELRKIVNNRQTSSANYINALNGTGGAGQPMKPLTGGDQPKEGMTATNKATGQKIIFRGGKFVPLTQ